jgi:hypothetical protein
MILCNFLAAGPTLAIIQTAQDFFPNWKETGLGNAIAKTASSSTAQPYSRDWVTFSGCL